MVYKHFFHLFFYDVNFKKIKINVLYKIILGKPGLGMFLKFMDGSIKPHRFSKIELEADVVKRLKDHSSSGKAVVGDADDGVFHDPGIFHYFCPHAKHKRIFLSKIRGCHQLL